MSRGVGMNDAPNDRGMGDRMTNDEALEIVAQAALRYVAEDLGDKWDEFPEVGEYDWDRICARACQLAPDPGLEEFRTAYSVLSDVADGHES